MSDHDPLCHDQESAGRQEGTAPDRSESAAGRGGPLPPPEEVRLSDGRIEHPRVSYQRDKPPVVAVFALLFLAACYATANYFAVWKIFEVRERDEQTAKESGRPAALQLGDVLPVEPRLEQLDRLSHVETPNVNRRYKVDEALLESYGPTKESGFVHVPIGRAMDYLVGRLPAPKQASGESRQPARDQGLIDAGDSNSGRMFRGRP